ncbi:hypothetical protein JJV70_13785 [Streptomyces sp. JJ66]|uniref:hypothetical protein n=1 Tax=Streptomyces sp. JJ66 TaxID=2803843 RepID=UPI001C5A4FF3|nr:hypothetical protein [Streptomyces sp. JJ66]MBW1603155.1 hypothetical protein [Streptomyces sp. JJ66]
MRQPHDAVTSDIDWEGERRWYDSNWAVIGWVFLLACIGVPAQSAISGNSPWISAGPWVGGLGAVIAIVPYQRRRLARQLGIRERQVPVLTRLMNQERIPRDPKARRAMAELVRRTHPNVRRGRWVWPVLATLFALLTVPAVMSGEPVYMSAGVFTTVGMAGLAVYSHRATARLVRLKARLGEEGVPQRADA